MAGTYPKTTSNPSVGFLQILPLMPHPDSCPGGTSGVRNGGPETRTRRDKTWVFPRDTPKWMVKIMENLMSKWMMWGVQYHYFRKHPCGDSS